MVNSKSYEIFLFTALAIILICLEIIACELSYENYGWLMQGICYLFLLTNIIPIILYIFKKKIAALILLLLIAVITIPDEFILAYDLIKLREESANITNYAYRAKLKTGKFPDDIKAYKFKFEGLKDRIKYTKYKDKDDFDVWFCVGTRSTDHFYRHSFENEKWYYYDD